MSVIGSTLHVGGQFTKAGGRAQEYFAQFGAQGSDPGPTGPLFADDFESGDLQKWNTVKNLVVQSTTKHAGSFAAANQGSASWAMARLPSAQTDLHARMWLNIATQDVVQVLRLSTDGGTNVLALLVLANEKLRLKSIATGATATSAAAVSVDWHDLQVHANVDTDVAELWVDGAQVVTLNSSLGDAALGRVEIGNKSTGKVYDAFYDDVTVDTEFITDPASP
jgi:hypothetical protein